jgi:hypothetical protein
MTQQLKNAAEQFVAIAKDGNLAEHTEYLVEIFEDALEDEEQERHDQARRVGRVLFGLALVVCGGYLISTQLGWQVGVAVPLLAMYVRGPHRRPNINVNFGAHE